MRKIESLLEEYAVSHQTTFNKKIHYVCVPLIFF
nr:Mpo1-like protein [Tenacibaculum sp. MAR_2010_89]